MPRFVSTSPRRASRFAMRNVSLLMLSLDGFLHTDLISESVADVLGFTPAEAMGAPAWFVSRVHPKERNAMREALLRAQATGKPFFTDCRLMHKQGRVVHGMLQAIPLPDPAQEGCESLELVFVDISERVALERALVHSEKLKTLGAISAELVHEIRNPLMALAGFARRLDKKLPDLPEAGIILQEAARLEALLSRITSYLQPAEFVLRECALNTLLADSLGLLAPELADKGVWCEADLSVDMPPAETDPEVLTQIVTTLLREAGMRTEHGGVFRARTLFTGYGHGVEVRHHRQPGHLEAGEDLFMPFEEGGKHMQLAICARMAGSIGANLIHFEEQDQSVFRLNLPAGGGECRSEDATPLNHSNGEDTGCFESDSGLLTRRRFDDLLGRTLRAQAKTHGSMALVLIGFDQTLTKRRLTATDGALQKALGYADLPARLDESTVAVILPGCGRKRLTAVLKRIGVALTTAKHLGGYALGGVVARPSIRTSARDMLEVSAKALFLAWRDGPGGVQILNLAAEATT